MVLALINCPGWDYRAFPSTKLKGKFSGSYHVPPPTLPHQSKERGQSAGGLGSPAQRESGRGAERAKRLFPSRCDGPRGMQGAHEIFQRGTVHQQHRKTTENSGHMIRFCLLLALIPAHWNTDRTSILLRAEIRALNASNKNIYFVEFEGKNWYCKRRLYFNFKVFPHAGLATYTMREDSFDSIITRLLI